MEKLSIRKKVFRLVMGLILVGVVGSLFIMLGHIRLMSAKMF